METLPEETQDISLEKKIKNPWWAKVIVHYVVIGMLLDLVYDKSIVLVDLIFYIFVFLLWVGILGPRVQSDKIILSKSTKIVLVLVAVWTTWEQYPTVIKIIQWIPSLWIP
jgi:hypothetical protein